MHTLYKKQANRETKDINKYKKENEKIKKLVLKGSSNLDRCRPQGLGLNNRCEKTDIGGFAFPELCILIHH